MDLFLVVIGIAAGFAAWILLALILAFLIESLTEYIFGTVFDKVAILQPFKWTLMYISALVGIFFCLFFKLDLLYILTTIGAVFAGQEAIIAISVPGMVITGVAVGRGANYLHDFISKYLPSKPPAQG